MNSFNLTDLATNYSWQCKSRNRDWTIQRRYLASWLTCSLSVDNTNRKIVSFYKTIGYVKKNTEDLILVHILQLTQRSITERNMKNTKNLRSQLQKSSEVFIELKVERWTLGKEGSGRPPGL